MSNRNFYYIALITSLFVSSHCNAKIKFEDCTTSADAPRCLIEKAHQYNHTNAKHDYNNIILFGAINWIQPENKKLLSNLKESLDSSSNFLASLGIKLSDDDSTAQIKHANETILLAAIALAAAAQDNIDPYSEPIVKKYLELSNNEFAVSFIALQLWSEIDTYNLWKAAENSPKGILNILRTVENSEQLTASKLSDLIWSWSETDRDNLIATTQAKLDYFISSSSKEEKIDLASRLARSFKDAKSAKLLMDAGGNSAENYNLEGIYTEIAIAILSEKYNENAAKLLVHYALSPSELEQASYKNRLENIPEALENGGALNELKELANGYLLAAENKQFRAEHRGDLYALASECFLRSKDKNAAIAAASKGLVFVKDAVYWRAKEIIKKAHTPENLARAAEGWGTDAVVALYRTGAIQAALDTGYLTGKDRYRYAVDAGEKPNPEWLINYFWQEGANYRTMGKNLLYINIQQRKSIFAAALPWLEKNPWACKDMEIQFDLAQLAASIGNREYMYKFLKTYAKQIDNEKKERDFYAQELAEQWKRDERILSYFESHPELLANDL